MTETNTSFPALPQDIKIVLVSDVTVERIEKIGVHCLLGVGMNHAKVMLVDDRIGTMGSQNLDTLSFDWNVESGIFFDNKHMVAELRKIIALWMNEALPFPAQTYIPRWYDILFAFLLRLFQRTP